MSGHPSHPTESSSNVLPPLIESIHCIIPIEDNDPAQASLMQGFSRSLMQHVGIIRRINTLPSDLWEFTPEGNQARLARRMLGQAPIKWFGQSYRALTCLITPVYAPFSIIFLGPSHDFERYRNWIESHQFPLTVVAESDHAIRYRNFNTQSLQQSFLEICDALNGKVDPSAIESARSKLESWVEPSERNLGYQVGGHNSVHPNVSALNAAGFRNIVYGPFEQISGDIDPYVEQICRTSQSILNERSTIGQVNADRYFARPPSLNLFAPAIYPHMTKVSLSGSPFSAFEKRRFLAVSRLLERQEGYSLRATTKAQAEALFGSDNPEQARPHFLLQERSAELRLATECVATISASEISAVLRMPNAVNRTVGQVRQFAQQYHGRSISDRKRVESFRKVQKAITESIPDDFLPFVEQANGGIRLICDAHLEWIEVRGLPLNVQKNLTRLPTTPGNLLVDQLSAKRYVHLTVSDFSEVLILSALREEDPISRFLPEAIKHFQPLFSQQLSIRTVRVGNRRDLLDALNSFNGAMMIFDGHGSHQPGKAATLSLLEEDVNIWELQAEIPRVPPIVILSACDTHAADRNHVTTANGFLSLGARAVLGTVFPIDARPAASFVARLLYRVTDFVPRAHQLFDRSLTWMEIMGGMIRMQLLTDFCSRLERLELIDAKTYRDVHFDGNTLINSGAHLWPFEEIIDGLSKWGIDQSMGYRELRTATANSTVIGYLQLGRPETVIIHSTEAFAELAKSETQVPELEIDF